MLLTLTGCQKEKEIKPQTVFSASFSLSYNEMQIKGEFSADEEKNVSVSVNSPDTLKGLRADFDGEKFDISYNGMAVTYQKSDLPDGAFFKLVCLALEKISSTEGMTFEETDDGYSSTADTELGSMTITLDTDYYIKSIEIPSQGFYLKLTKQDG